MVMWTRTLRAGVLAAALLAGPASAREIVPTSWAELIRGLIPSVVNITVRIAGTAAPDQALVSAGQSALAVQDRASVLVSSSIPPA